MNPTDQISLPVEPYTVIEVMGLDDLRHPEAEIFVRVDDSLDRPVWLSLSDHAVWETSSLDTRGGWRIVARPAL